MAIFNSYVSLPEGMFVESLLFGKNPMISPSAHPKIHDNFVFIFPLITIITSLLLKYDLHGELRKSLKC
jgi:hypothetical protein